MRPVDSLVAVNLRELAELTGMGRESIRVRIARAAIEPVKRNGRSCYYPSQACLQVLFGKEGAEGENSASEERRLLDKVRREEVQLRVDERRGSLIPVSTIGAQLGSIVSAFKVKMRTLPTKLAPMLATAKKPAAAQKIVLDGIDEVLADLAAGAENAAEQAQDYRGDATTESLAPEPGETGRARKRKVGSRKRKKEAVAA